MIRVPKPPSSWTCIEDSDRVCEVDLRILYLHQYFSTRAGTAGTRSYEFARHLVREGHEVAVVTGLSDRTTIADCAEASSGLISRNALDGIEVVVLGIRYSNEMSHLRRMVSFGMFPLLATWAGLTVGKLDLVLATSTPLTIGVPGYVVSRLRRVPFVFEVRDLWPEAPVALGVLKNRVLIGVAGWAEAFFYAKAHTVIAVTKGIHDTLRHRGIPEAKLELITHGADVDLFKPSPKNNAVRAELGLQGKFVAGYTGAHGLANGLNIVIEAARLMRDHPDVILLLMGDGAHKANLVRLAEEYGLENVIFLDPRPRSQMPEVLAAIDLCLQILKNVPYFEKACPNKLFDYLAAGRPVLVNLPGEVQRMLEDSGAGIFVQPDDPHGMAQAILELKANPTRCAEMGRKARELAMDFAREKQAQKLESVLRSVVQE